MSQPIRIGFVGAGDIVKTRHLPGLQKIEGVQFSAVANRSLASGEKVAKEWNIPKVSDDWKSLLSCKDLDVIWIGTAPYLHAQITIAALESGKHVFCQARMAMNLKEARAMREAARKQPDRITMLCPPPHGMKHGSYFKYLLKTDAVGKIRQVRFKALNSVFANPQTPTHWRQQIEQSGENILTVGIYAEVLENWLGAPQRLCAQTQILYPQRGEYRVRVPDQVQVLAEWEEFSGTMEWSAVTSLPPSERLEVDGDKGSLIYDFLTDKIEFKNSQEKELKPIEIPSSFIGAWNVEETFIQSIRAGISPEPSFGTGYKYMAFLDAIHRSQKSGQFVDITTD